MFTWPSKGEAAAYLPDRKSARESADRVLSRMAREGEPYVELIVVDRGPGVDDLGALIRDGKPQAPGQKDGLGVGLSAVRRLASDFDHASTKGAGTVVFARFREQTTARRRSDDRFSVGSICSIELRSARSISSMCDTCRGR